MINDPVTSTGSGALGYYIIYQGFDDIELRRLLARVYWKFSPMLSEYRAPFLEEEKPPMDEKRTREIGRRKIKVGFHSAFFFRHSVGLLTEGVIMNIDRSKFHVTVFIQNPEKELHDDVARRIRASADDVFELPNDINSSREVIASQELDVLVYGEVGMESIGYFLPFSRLARRTAVFWGHALTSGISNYDGVELTMRDPSEVGGIDYFVTSRMFERTSTGPPQHRYTESLYIMEGMTTHFSTPMKERPGMSRSAFGLPEDMNLYLCPQTLYKIHPDFDNLIIGILKRDSSAAIVFPVAQKQEWTDQLMRRMMGNVPSFSNGNFLASRILFVRRTDFDEFIALAKLANVILDPFPVGGGRSSLEIFSTGSPIVVAYHRTNILQLTYGMYEMMGILDLVSYNDEDYISTAVRVATNRTLESEIRGQILQRVSVLYENRKVVEEWEQFLEFAANNERPITNSYFSSALNANEKKKKEEEKECDSAAVTLELSADMLEAASDEFSADNVAYAVKMNHDDDLIVVVIAKGEDPLSYARQLSEKIGAEYVKYRWIAAILQHGVNRLLEDVVWRVDVRGKGLVEVRRGDDLSLLANFHGMSFGLNSIGIDKLRSVLVSGVPEHSTRAWLNVRRKQDRLTGIVRGENVNANASENLDKKSSAKIGHVPSIDNSNDEHNKRRYRRSGYEGLDVADFKSNGECYLTVALTTCKRLHLFKRTIETWGELEEIKDALCEVIVVDDGSTVEDREKMIQMYPNFRFIWKEGEEQRGHANSLNIIVGLVRTRYLLYLEDDWQWVGERGVKDVITDAMEVLIGSGEIEGDAEGAISQVLLNDQSSRSCAEGRMSECDSSGHKGKAGWERTSRLGVPFLEHEFGVVYPNHQFSYWPGFSLNPGIWDIQRLQQKMTLTFDAEDERFEQSFSVKAYDAGLIFAHLPHVSVQHTGGEVSSYVLNGMERPF